MKLKFEKILNFFGLALLELCNFKVKRLERELKDLYSDFHEDNEGYRIERAKTQKLTQKVLDLELELEGGRLTNGSNVTSIRDLKGSLSAQIRQTDAFRKALMRERSIAELELDAMRKRLSIANLNKREKQERLQEVFAAKEDLTKELKKVRRQLEAAS